MTITSEIKEEAIDQVTKKFFSDEGLCPLLDRIWYWRDQEDGFSAKDIAISITQEGDFSFSALVAYKREEAECQHPPI
jgi:hypothetical protein